MIFLISINLIKESLIELLRTENVSLRGTDRGRNYESLNISVHDQHRYDIQCWYQVLDKKFPNRAT